MPLNFAEKIPGNAIKTFRYCYNICCKITP